MNKEIHLYIYLDKEKLNVFDVIKELNYFLSKIFNKNLPTITFDSRGKFTKKSMLKIIDGIKKGYKIKDLADDSKKTE